jgi:hypothetical protein
LLRFFSRTAEGGFKILASMRKHGRGLRLKNFVGYIYRAGDKHMRHILSNVQGLLPPMLIQYE